MRFSLHHISSKSAESISSLVSVRSIVSERVAAAAAAAKLFIFWFCSRPSVSQSVIHRFKIPLAICISIVSLHRHLVERSGPLMLLCLNSSVTAAPVVALLRRVLLVDSYSYQWLGSTTMPRDNSMPWSFTFKTTRARLSEIFATAHSECLDIYRCQHDAHFAVCSRYS